MTNRPTRRGLLPDRPGWRAAARSYHKKTFCNTPEIGFTEKTTRREHGGRQGIFDFLKDFCRLWKPEKRRIPCLHPRMDRKKREESVPVFADSIAPARLQPPLKTQDNLTTDLSRPASGFPSGLQSPDEHARDGWRHRARTGSRRACMDGAPACVLTCHARRANGPARYPCPSRGK